MSRPEILDRCAVEILIDNCRADVRPARDGGGVSQLLPHAAPHRGDGPLFLRLGLRRTVLGERDRREQRAAPRPEVLRGEVLAEIRANVFVQLRASERAQPTVPLIAAATRTTG